MLRIALIACLAVLPMTAASEDAGMTPERMLQIITALDPDVRNEGPGVAFTINDVPVMVIADAGMNRMRAMVPIRRAEELTAEELERVMQANFDTALDARYAIARGQLWAVFIHPLQQLERDQLISGIGQTVNLALSYGTLYSSGGAQFGRGDSGELHEQLLEDLLKRGQDI